MVSHFTAGTLTHIQASQKNEAAMQKMMQKGKACKKIFFKGNNEERKVENLC